MLDASTFDGTKPLVMGRTVTLNGHPMAKGDSIRIVDDESDARGELTAEVATRLWQGGTIVYADQLFPTPIESPEDSAERLAVLEPMGDDLFLLRAPWLDESETITGEERALARRADVVQQGIDLFRQTAGAHGLAVANLTLDPQDGFVLTEAGSNGYYEITGPGLDEPEKVRGKAAAETRLGELRALAAAPPPPAQPAGATGEVVTTAGEQGGGPAIVDQENGAGEPEAPATE